MITIFDANHHDVFVEEILFGLVGVVVIITGDDDGGDGTRAITRRFAPGPFRRRESRTLFGLVGSPRSEAV